MVNWLSAVPQRLAKASHMWKKIRFINDDEMRRSKDNVIKIDPIQGQFQYHLGVQGIEISIS